MKNSKRMSNLLLFLIIGLILVANVYFFSASRATQVDKQEADIKENENKQIENESGKREDNDNDEFNHFVSDNAKDDFGLKVITDYIQFSSALNRIDENTFFVFGRTGCHYCELYEPVLKEIAAFYKIEIFYVNLAELSKEDTASIMNSNLIIPAKCSREGVDVSLNKGFGTPLTLFVKNSETYDCIRGYKDKANLIKSLKEIGYVK